MPPPLDDDGGGYDDDDDDNNNIADDDAVPGPLMTALREEDGDFDFCMTNPPFFESADEVRVAQGGQERERDS